MTMKRLARPAWTHSRPATHRAGRFTILPVILAGLVLSGCLAPIFGTQERPSLKQFESCDIHFPNGTAVQCRDERQMLEATPGDPPPTWACYSRREGHRYTIRACLSPTGEWALGYDVTESPWATEAVARLDPRDRSGALLFGWNLTSRTGWVMIPRANEGSLDVTWVGSELPEASGLIEGATMRTLWNLFDGRNKAVWAITEITTPAGQSYFFDPMQPNPAAPDLYAPRGVDIVGSDFGISLRYQTIGFSADNGLASLFPPTAINASSENAPAVGGVAPALLVDVAW